MRYTYNFPRQISSLLGYKLQWHVHVMKDILTSHKILILFIALLVSPTLGSLQYFITTPLKGLITINNDYSLVIMSLGLFQGTAIVIALINQSIYSASWDGFLSILPISNKQHMIIETILLCFIDVILWASLLLSVTIVLIHSNLSRLNFCLVLSKCLLNVSAILLLQTILIKRKFRLIGILLLIDLVFIVQNAWLNKALILSINCILAALSWFFLNLCFLNVDQQQRAKINIKTKASNDLISFNFINPCSKVQLKNLLFNNVQQHSLIIICLVFSMFMAWAVMKFIISDKNVVFAASIFMLINTLILSNLLPKLYMQRLSIKQYLSSLPISNTFIFKADFIIIGLPLLIINLSILLMMFSVGNIGFNFNKYSIAIISSFIYMASIYILQIKLNKYGLLSSIIILCFFISANHYILSN